MILSRYFQQVGIALFFIVSSCNSNEYNKDERSQKAIYESSNEDDARKHYDAGNILMESNDFIGAISEYNKTLQTRAKFVIAYRERGTAKYKLHDYRGAISDFNKAIEAMPTNVDSYFSRGISYLELKDYNSALNDFISVNELEPYYLNGYFYSAIAKYSSKDYKGAIEYYNIVINLHPGNAIAYHNRGLARLMLGQKNDACLDFSKAGELGNSKSYETIREYCQ